MGFDEWVTDKRIRAGSDLFDWTSVGYSGGFANRKKDDMSQTCTSRCGTLPIDISWSSPAKAWESVYEKAFSDVFSMCVSF